MDKEMVRFVRDIATRGIFGSPEWYKIEARHLIRAFDKERTVSTAQAPEAVQQAQADDDGMAQRPSGAAKHVTHGHGRTGSE